MAGRTQELMIRIAGRVDPSLLNATRNAQSQVSGLGSSLAGIGKMAVKAVGGLAVGAALTDTINTYKDFDQAMAMTAATAGATGDAYKQLESAAMEAGRGTTKTATEAAQALGYLALAGYSVEDSTKALMPILKLSEATQMDLATCSDEVTDSMSAMGLTVNDLSGYLDILCKANNKSNQTAQQLMEAEIKCGGVLKGLGISAQDGATALGVLANRGLKGSDAGTALSAIMSNLTTGTGQAGQMMEKLGVSAFDSNGKFIGLQATLLKLNKATSGLTEEERNAAFAAIGGKEQIKTLNALMSGLTTVTADGRTEWNALNAELNNADGSLDKMNKQVTGTLNGAMSRFGSALDDIKIRAGKAFGPTLAIMIDQVSGMMPQVSNTIEAIGNELEYVATVVKDNWGNILPIIEGIGIGFATWKITSFVLALPEAVAGIRAMIGVQKALTLAKIADKIETIQLQAMYWADILAHTRATVVMGARTVATYAMAAATGVWSGVCAIATGVTTAFGAAIAFLTSPIGIAVVAITAVIAAGILLYKNWDTVKAKASELYAAFQEKFPALGAIVQSAVNVVVKIFNGMKNAFTGVINFVKDLFTGNFSALGGDIQQIFGGIWQSLSNMATGGLQILGTVVKVGLGKLGINLDDIFGPIAQKLGPKISALAGAVVNRFNSIREGLGNVWNSTIGFLGNVIGTSGSAIGGFFSNALGVAGNMASAVLKMVIQGWSTIFNTISSIVGPVVSVVAQMFSSAQQIVGGFISGAVNVFMTVYNTATQYLSAIVAFVQGVFAFGLSAGWSAAVAVFQVAVDTIGGVLNGMITAVGGIIDFLTGVFSGDWSAAWNGIVTTFGGIFSGVVALAKAPINGVIALVNSMIGAINSINFDIPDFVPGIGGKHIGFNIPSVPALASGGIATKATLAQIGEGSEPEAVIPLSKLAGMLSSYMPKTADNTQFTMATKGGDDEQESMIPFSKLAGMLSSYMPKTAGNTQFTMAPMSEDHEQESVMPFTKLSEMLTSYMTKKSVAPAGAGEASNIVFSPNVYFTGDTSKEDVQQVMKNTFAQFKQWYDQMQKDNKRKKF